MKFKNRSQLCRVIFEKSTFCGTIGSALFFCSCLNNAIAGFIGDHYSNCFIIASTLALAAAHSLSTPRPCHTLCAAQQYLTLDQELGGSLSLSLWPAWQRYSIPVLERKNISPFLCLSFYKACFIFSLMPCSLSILLSFPAHCSFMLFYAHICLSCSDSILCW